MNDIIARPTGKAPAITTFVARSTPIYMVGDSHALIYSDLIYREERYYHQHFATHARYIRGLQAANFADSNGNLNSAVAQALFSEGLFEQVANGSWQPFHQTNSTQAQSVAVARESARSSPIMVIFCGDLDLREVFIKAFAPASDFTIPGDVIDTTCALYRVEQTVPYQLVLELANKILSPLFQGLSILSRLGFVNLYLHTLKPMTPGDNAEFEGGYFAPAALRYKATRLFNALFREFAGQGAVRILDMWDLTTKNGFLDPQFALGDLVHLNKKAALLTIDTLLNDVIRRHVFATPALWEVARKQAVASYQARTAAPNEPLAADFAARNIAMFDLGRDFAKRIRSQIDFDSDIGNKHPRLDWCGNPIEPATELMLTATPSVAVLDEIHARFFSEDIERAIATCMGSDFTILLLRIFKSLPRSDIPKKGYHYDESPPGVLRGVMYLVDVDQDGGPFEYLDDAGNPHKLTGPAGTLLVFNANRYLHRGSPPLARNRENLDLVFAPLVTADTPRVMWAGMNNWPVDPFCYSTRGFRVSFGPNAATVVDS